MSQKYKDTQRVPTSPPSASFPTLLDLHLAGAAERTVWHPFHLLSVTRESQQFNDRYVDFNGRKVDF